MTIASSTKASIQSSKLFLPLMIAKAAAAASTTTTRLITGSLTRQTTGNLTASIMTKLQWSGSITTARTTATALRLPTTHSRWETLPANYVTASSKVPAIGFTGGISSPRPAVDLDVDSGQRLTVTLVSTLIGILALFLLVLIIVLVRKRKTLPCRRNSSGRKPAAGVNGHKDEAPASVELEQQQPLSPRSLLALDNLEYMRSDRLLTDDAVVKGTNHHVSAYVKPYACTSLLTQPAPHGTAAVSGSQGSDGTPYYSLPPLQEETPQDEALLAAEAGPARPPTGSRSYSVLTPPATRASPYDVLTPPPVAPSRPEGYYFVLDQAKP